MTTGLVRLVAVVLIFAVGLILGGCGSGSSTASKSASANNEARLGRAAGEAEVCAYKQATSKFYYSLIVSYEAVLRKPAEDNLAAVFTNHLCDYAAITNAPRSGSRMSPAAAAAATEVVKQYAEEHSQELVAGAKNPQEGLEELRKHGL